MKATINKMGVMSITPESEWENEMLDAYYKLNKDKVISHTIQFNKVD